MSEYDWKRISLFNSPAKLLFGLNSIQEVSKEIRSQNFGRILIVTDPNMVKLGYLDRVVGQLDEVNVEVFSSINGEPSLEILNELASRVRSQNHEAVLGLGGGSVLDSAKIASFSATNLGPIQEYLGVDRIREKGLPLICVPTTSGTGSEVTRFSVVKFENTKGGFVSNLIVPDIAIVDPSFTVSVPKKLTAHTGLDALSHALEAMISTWSTPLTDVLALGVVRYVFDFLERCYLDGEDLEARYYMSIASTMAGLSFNDPRVLLGHSIGQTIGPIYNIPHGLSVAVALPHVLEFYLSTSAGKIASMGEAVGIHIPEITVEENAEAFIDALKDLYGKLNTPLGLQEFKIPRSGLGELVENTLTLQPRSNSPIEFTEDNISAVYEKMWKGEL